MAEYSSASGRASKVSGTGLAGGGHIEAGVGTDPLNDSLLNRPLGLLAKTVIVDLDRGSACIDPNQGMDHELPAKGDLDLILSGRP